jgi:hypothetical protein
MGSLLSCPDRNGSALTEGFPPDPLLCSMDACKGEFRYLLEQSTPTARLKSSSRNRTWVLPVSLWFEAAIQVWVLYSEVPPEYPWHWRDRSILRAIYEEHRDHIHDFSYDIYCPKTYAHHARLTVWQPPFYLEVFSPEKLARCSRGLLGKLKVNRASDYVVGINSRLNQYSPVHLLMLDIDSVDPEVETLLAAIGGIVLKSGRGFHFISRGIIDSQEDWVNMMTGLKRDRIMRQYLDMDHVDISLQRGYATLRVTESSIKPHIPFFYKEL